MNDSRDQFLEANFKMKIFYCHYTYTSLANVWSIRELDKVNKKNK